MFGRRAAKQSPKRPQNEPKIYPKTAPRGPKCRSEVLLDFRLNFSTDFKHFWVPKGIPKDSQKHSKIALGAPGPPEGLQGASRDPPGGLQGAILVSCWDPRELIFEPFKRPFSKLARAPPHDRKHSSKSLPKGSFATAAGQMRTTPKAQWPVWGRRPTGDPATEPFRLTRGRGAKRILVPESTVTSTASEKPSVYRR